MINQWRRRDLVPGGHTSYSVFTRDNCQHIVGVRLCIGQSKLKKIKICKLRGALAPVPHSWRRQCDRQSKVCYFSIIWAYLKSTSDWRKSLRCRGRLNQRQFDDRKRVTLTDDWQVWFGGDLTSHVPWLEWSQERGSPEYHTQCMCDFAFA